MTAKAGKTFLFASDFDQTLTFKDSGFILCEVAGVPVADFERKLNGMTRLNLVQQGAELAYLLLHDPQFQEHVRREHLFEVGRRIRLKENIRLLYEILDRGIDGDRFEFFVLSAAPVEIVQSALRDIVPPEKIFGTEFQYSPAGQIQTIVRTTAGYGKVARIDELQARLGIAADRIVYVGDGSSDVHVMLHVNAREGFTIAVSESKHVVPIARRTVLSSNAMATLVPILEGVLGWDRLRIREFFSNYGVLIQEWEKANTDWLTLRTDAAESASAR